MRDDKTNKVKDVIVRHLRGGEPLVEYEHGVPTPGHTRYIEGLDIEIPWPQDEPPDYKAEESDTLRLTVEEKTYVPSINPPFPTPIIDELRDPYARERSRHEQEFIERKLKEDAMEAWKKSRTKSQGEAGDSEGRSHSRSNGAHQARAVENARERED
jgi:large subunit ribosomal protein L24